MASGGIGTTQPIGGTLDGPPKPPAGYQLQPKPPAGYKIAPAPATNYDDMFESPKDTTAEGVPDFVRDDVGTPQTNVVANPTERTKAGVPAVAYVNQGDTHTINVQEASGYNAATAAHEATHLDQNSKNKYFTDNLTSMLPNGVTDGSVYDYGGVEGLIKNHPNIGHLNAEQQASIVQDLTTKQAMLRPHMTQAELAQWDKDKNALERPIQQLQRIPAKQAPTKTQTADDWLATHTIFHSHPLQQVLDILDPPKIDTRPLPAPTAPSTALGYANPSKLVRGGDLIQ